MTNGRDAGHDEKNTKYEYDSRRHDDPGGNLQSELHRPFLTFSFLCVQFAHPEI
jgi:hypothetical protein